MLTLITGHSPDNPPYDPDNPPYDPDIHSYYDPDNPDNALLEQPFGRV